MEVKETNIDISKLNSRNVPEDMLYERLSLIKFMGFDDEDYKRPSITCTVGRQRSSTKD